MKKYESPTEMNRVQVNEKYELPTDDEKGPD